MSWLEINIGRSLVRSENANSIMIKVPWQDWLVWLPTSLVRRAGGDRLVVSFPEDRTFTLFRTGKGEYNRKDRIAERVVGATEFAGMFGHSPRKETFVYLFWLAVFFAGLWFPWDYLEKFSSSAENEIDTATKQVEKIENFVNRDNPTSKPIAKIGQPFTGLRFKLVPNPRYVPGQELLTGESKMKCMGYRYEDDIIVASSVVDGAYCAE